MKNIRIIVLFALGVVSAFADPVSKQKLPADNKQSQSENTESDKKHDDQSLSNKADLEQIKEITATNMKTKDHIISNNDADIQIFLEETIDTPIIHFDQMGHDTVTHSVINTKEVSLNNYPDEIMETAAGFLPIPILRKKHNARRRFATRRYFRRRPYPYSDWRFMYPYYYNSFYRPSSLNYFYY